MGFETIAKEKAKTTYYGYTEPDEPKENYQRLKKGDSVEGYFFQTYERDSQFGKRKNHVLVKEDGTHHIVPGSKDVDSMFATATEGLLTRYTYDGKKTFDYKKDDGSTGVAKAIKGILEQDKEKTCSFEGDSYSAVVVLGKDASTSTNTITAEDVPF